MTKKTTHIGTKQDLWVVFAVMSGYVLAQKGLYLRQNDGIIEIEIV